MIGRLDSYGKLQTCKDQFDSGIIVRRKERKMFKRFCDWCGWEITNQSLIPYLSYGSNNMLRVAEELCDSCFGAFHRLRTERTRINSKE